MKKLTLLLLLCLSPAVVAQTDAKPGTGPMPNMHDMPSMGEGFHGFHGHSMHGSGPNRMMMRLLYPPEMIMHHQDELNLTASQIDAIKKEMKTYQNNIIDKKWDIQTAGDDLRKELEKDRIDKQQALSQLDKLMAAKNAMKKQHLSMLIAIHNILTREQIEKLKNLSCPGMRHFRRTPPMPMPQKRSS
jgi:Spy/CpxP family protein refolding chaperone